MQIAENFVFGTRKERLLAKRQAFEQWTIAAAKFEKYLDMYSLMVHKTAPLTHLFSARVQALSQHVLDNLGEGPSKDWIVRKEALRARVSFELRYPWLSWWPFR